ncbi:hypothetical protein AB0H71_32060 [Nocardia sp. NPDC050697]|uniref:hypothetical protein n=1 Tax=Nocardia sp. NPDC050697 TaxID=3155158 RepID=UPI0033E49F9C
MQFLGRGGTEGGGCPSLFAAEGDAYVVQGWRTEAPGVIEIPHLLLGFALPDTFIGATMTDTGRGTFTLQGEPLPDAETLAGMDIDPGETAVVVPRVAREFYGNAASSG